MSPWDKLLEHPHSRGHLVQLYQPGEDALTNNVGRYLREGFSRGDSALMIVTPHHQRLFCKHLDRSGADLPALLASGRLVFRDAGQVLGELMVGGQLQWPRFERVIRQAMRQVRAFGHEGLRAYGEMVGVLWKKRQFAAAIRLEQLWNRLLEQCSFSLYCAYAIDVFGKEFAVANLEGVLCTHTHLIPSQPDGTLESALNLSMDEILGSQADDIRLRIKAGYRPGWAVMPTAEAIVLWLRKNLPEQADRIVAQARHHYDLLNPQNQSV